MAVIQFEDWEGLVEVLIFPDLFGRSQKLIDNDIPLLIRGKLDRDESSLQIRATEIHSLDRVKETLSRMVTIRIGMDASSGDMPERLQSIIDEKRGSAEIVFALEFSGRYTVLLRPNPYVKVTPDRDFVERIERICGPNSVQLN